MLMKPINAAPCNETKIPGDINIRYEFKNDVVDKSYTAVTDLKNGSNILGKYTTLQDSEYNESFKVDSEGEYIWESFYFKTPNNENGESCISISKTKDGQLNMFLENSGLIESVEPSYNIEYSQVNVQPSFGIVYYSESDTERYLTRKTAVDSGYYDGLRVVSGTVLDYIGYPVINPKGFFDIIVEDKFEDYSISIYLNSKLVTNSKILGKFSVFGYEHRWLILEDQDFWNKIDKIANNHFTYVPNATGELNINYLNISKCNFYNINNIVDIIDSFSLLQYGSSYYYIKDVFFDGFHYLLKTMPIINNVEFGKEFTIWNTTQAEFNITPPYYFRIKKSPQVNVTCDNIIDNKTGHIQNKFNLNFESSSNIKLNYSYIYLYSLNPKNYIWKLVSQSEMLFGDNIEYTFDNLVNGRKYKVCAVCTDIDGDNWDSNELEFEVNIDYIECDIPISFNRNFSTIDILLSEILSSYTTVDLKFYKIKNNDIQNETIMHYVGGGMAKKNGMIMFDKLSDYNIENETEYKYYIVADYSGKNSDNNVTGSDFYFIKNCIRPKFEGTSIMGIINSETPMISAQFNLFYHISQDFNELTNELSREYLYSFNQYPKELKGYQNHISSSCSGLLGYEDKGVYYEPKGVRKVWIDFINDDSIKLYRGIDGETLIIGIETSKIKPYYYPNVGIVNEVFMTFKEIDSAKKYSIFTTEIVGE